MPFGLLNARATFQSMMNDLLRAYLRRFVLVFFYDILIYSQEREEHLKHLGQVLNTLRQHQLVGNVKKCEFGRKWIKYTGHLISKKGVKMDRDKVVTVEEWLEPKTLKGLRRVFGSHRILHEICERLWKNCKALDRVVEEGTIYMVGTSSNNYGCVKGSHHYCTSFSLTRFQAAVPYWLWCIGEWCRSYSNSKQKSYCFLYRRHCHLDPSISQFMKNKTHDFGDGNTTLEALFTRSEVCGAYRSEEPLIFAWTKDKNS